MATPDLSFLLRPERTRPRGRATGVTLLGLVLVPLVVGGLLTWALWQPTERLDRMQAAVVNLDTPVQIDGQIVPLGRQLAAALVTSDGATATATATDATAADDPPPAQDRAANVSGHDSSGNFTWVLTDADDAATGLADGTYTTVVTIPSTFSAAATSAAGDPADVVRAVIDVRTSQRSRLVDAAVSQAVTGAAVGLLNAELTTSVLTNVYLGFSTLHASLGDAADGATQVASGAQQLGSGAAGVAAGTASLADGVGQLSTGATELSDGVGELATGASDLASGLGQLADQTAASARAAQAGLPATQQFVDGLDALARGVNGPGGLAEGTTGLAQGASGLQATLDGVLATLETTSTACAGGDAAACATVVGIVQAQRQPAGPTGGAAPSLTYLAGSVAAGAAGLDAAVNDGAGGVPALAASVTQLAAGGHQLADGVTGSVSGAGSLAGYLRQSATGAAQLASGATQAAVGADQLAAGARDAEAGAGELSSGATELATGAGSLGTGADDLASGLTTAVEQVPTYTDDEADAVAHVVATPVAVTGEAGGLFGSRSVPFLVTVALWLGGLATFLVLGAVNRRAMGSTRSSVMLALGSFAPGALVGVIQGLAVTAVMAFAVDLTPGDWVAFTAVAVMAGVAFAAVNQGLVAVLGGTGRFVSVVIAVIGLAFAVVSTVPALVDGTMALLPLASALTGLQGVVGGVGGAGGAVVALAVWTVGGLALTVAAVARRRVVPAGQLARWVRAA